MIQPNSLKNKLKSPQDVKNLENKLAIKIFWKTLRIEHMCAVAEPAKAPPPKKTYFFCLFLILF